MKARFNQPTIRLRAGATQPYLISPAWRSVSAGLPRGDLSAPVVAWVRCHKSFDVRRDDVLIFPDERRFVVQQFETESETNLYACGEVDPLIPDEFNSGLVDQWWSASGAGFSIDLNESVLKTTPPISDKPSIVPQLSQVVTGDFDVYTRLNLKAVDVLTAATRYVLIGATVDAQVLGIYVGLKAVSYYTYFTRLDEWDDASDLAEVTTDAITQDASAWVRLQRTGRAFRTYGSPVEPRFNRDWEELLPVNHRFTDTRPVNVGFAAYRSNFGFTDTVSWDFIRNWKGDA